MGRTAFALEAYEQPEHDLQIDCTKMLTRLLLPTVQWTAIDHAHTLDPTIGRNGRPIGFLQAQKRKARGVKAGICDYLFWHRKRGFAIELKRNAYEAEHPSDDQIEFMLGLRAAEVPIKICWTIWQVHDTANAWGLMIPHEVMA